jgi:hypothetical protein
LTPTIISTKSKQRQHHYQRQEREHALQASLLVAVPEYPASLDDEDNNKLPNPTIDTAADIKDNYINNSNANSNDTNNNDNNNNSNKSADKDTITPITRIRLYPVKKTIMVVVDNTYTCKQYYVASPDLNNKSNTTTLTSQAKHARTVPNPCPAGKVS